MLFQRLVREENVTVLLATHDATVDEFASEIYLMSDGQITEHIENRWT